MRDPLIHGPASFEERVLCPIHQCPGAVRLSSQRRQWECDQRSTVDHCFGDNRWTCVTRLGYRFVSRGVGESMPWIVHSVVAAETEHSPMEAIPIAAFADERRARQWAEGAS